MSLIEIIGGDEQSLRRSRLGHRLTILVAILALLYGLSIRNGLASATAPYENLQAGISLRYPANWLLDSASDDYVLRVQDMRRLGYKTTFQIEILPIGEDITARNILDTLDMQRPNSLGFYRRDSISQYVMPDGTEATQMRYTFVDVDPNRFLQSVPTVVTGQDVLIVRGEQAVIITFRSEAETFEDDLATFYRILATLEY